MSPSPPESRSPLQSLGRGVVRVFGSYTLAIVVLAFLLLLTFLGTLEQRQKSLYDVQREYFESAIHVYDLKLGDGVSIPLPLPGAYLLLALLGVNLIVGGIVRIRKAKATYGILVAHLGMVFLLLAGFVEHQWSSKGHMSVYEGESSDEFESYYEWELAVVEHLPDGAVREHVIPHEGFAGLDDGDEARFVSAALPFDLVLSDFARNTTPDRVRTSGGGERVELRTLSPDPAKAERDLAGLRARVIPKAGEDERYDVLLWGFQRWPARVTVAGRAWDLDLRHKSWKLPFRIRLDDFQMEQYPGTSMPSRFSSFVTRTEGKGTSASESKIHITMNEPLRHEGYTLYQSGWGPPEARPGARLYSSLSVVRNPADQWPLWACLVIAAGLIWAFGRKLLLHIKAEARRHA